MKEMMVLIIRECVKRSSSMKEFNKKSGKARRHTIKVIDDVIAGATTDMRKKLDETPQLRDHDPSPRSAPISPSISPSESSYDSESVSTSSGSLRQATTWFGEQGKTSCDVITSDRDSEEMRQPEDEVMLLVQDLSSQACTSPPASPENSSGDTSDTESIGSHSPLRQVVTTSTTTSLPTPGISDHDSNRSHPVISKSQYSSIQTNLINRDEVRYSYTEI